MPTAPAACAFFAFTTNVHTPRSTRTILPATCGAFVYAVQPSVVVGPSGLAASSAATTSPVRSKPCAPNSAEFACFVPATAAGAFTFASAIELVHRNIRMRGRWPSAGVDMFALLVPVKSCASA